MLHPKLVELIDSAQHRVWIKVPWWDTSGVARELLGAVTGAAKRGLDVQVFSRPEASNDAAHRDLRRAGVELVPVRYIHEKELLADAVAITHSMNFTRTEIERNQNSGTLVTDPVGIEAIEAGFRQQLANRQAALVGEEEWTSSEKLIPPALQKYMTRYSRLNPLQSMAVPVVSSTSGHVMVVAPTSAGKTLIGEVAVLRSIVEEDRPAVWLLPARALAAEVGEATRRWREHGIRAIELTGETNVSSEAVQKAQLWVATTEKFEALYRRSSLRDFISKVGCIVIDEVHLVGDPERGATLESLIARLRAVSERTRIVALSATVSNAEELASWFNAKLVRSSWRPTVLTTQFVPFDEPQSGGYEATQQAKDQAVRALLDSFGDEPQPDGQVAGDTTHATDGSVLVFCGSKNNVRRSAALVADLPSHRQVDDDHLVSACFERGVGLHFRDAPRAGNALKAFNCRELTTLVATSGLSTGVNTPARFVIIRDLELGMTPLEVSQAQQMLGRAGRAGQEPEGFGFLLVPRDQESEWRRKLNEGYAARSQVVSKLTDVILAEVLLGSITDRQSAASWFEETFAFAQSGDPLQVEDALDFLLAKGFVVADGSALTITELGKLTCRLMVDAQSAAAILARLADLPHPASAAEAEELLLAVVTASTEKFREWPINKRVYQPIVESLLNHWSRRAVGLAGEDFGPRFCMAAAHLALRDQPKLRAKAPQGISLADFRRAVDDLPRYLAWISALGYLRDLTWAPAVSGDLARRLTWWTLFPQPQRGSGRLLWLLENSLNPENRRTKMQDLWRRATDHGFVGPDAINARPRDVDVSAEQFGDLIRSRAVLEVRPSDGVVLEVAKSTNESRMTVLSNSGSRRAHRSVVPVPARLEIPVPQGSAAGLIAADLFLYTRSGDWAYDNATTAIPQDLSTRVNPIQEAQSAIEQLQPVATVVKPLGRIRKLLMSEHRQRAAALAPHIAADPQLQSVARALAGHDDEPASAVIAMRGNLVKFLGMRQSADIRPAVMVLKSGEATPDERELVLCALLGSLGFEVGVATINGSLASLIHIGDGWKMVTLTIEGNASVEPLIPANLPLILHAVSPPPKSPDDVTRPRCSWMAEFVL
ncbi:hypothetical protein AXK60_20510 [Tsukamurella pseudospumae]|uniref:DEAD/DEAH box helicase n=2 Tax=Tsukamurella pseudospumae TaxID=239498 RepID=A0A138AV63_9ACTN|nr:hypothetical protein AXK60_20510 [Tsukamurella pseudospumae]